MIRSPSANLILPGGFKCGSGGVRLDLNAGIDSAVRKDEDKCAEERLQHLLRWISLNKDKFKVEVRTMMSKSQEPRAEQCSFIP